MGSACTTEGDHQLARAEGNKGREITLVELLLCANSLEVLKSPTLVQGTEGYLLIWSWAEQGPRLPLGDE